MEFIFDRLSPPQIVAVISVVVGGIVMLAMIVAVARYQSQALADATALKRERQQAEFALKQKLIDRGGVAGLPSLEELLKPDAGIADEEAGQLNAELAKRFGTLELPAGMIEETLTRILPLDPARKKMILGVLDELLEAEASPESILAALRPLCGAILKEKEPASASS